LLGADEDDEDDDEDEFRLESDDDGGEGRGDSPHGRGEASSPTDGAEEDNDEENDDDDDNYDDDDDCWQDLFDDCDLEKELDLLAQEDLEAAVATLLADGSGSGSGAPAGGGGGGSGLGADPSHASAARLPPPPSRANGGAEGAAGGDPAGRPGAENDPGDDAANASAEAVAADASSSSSSPRHLLRPSKRQRSQLRDLLQKHYQLLLQQSALAARAASAASGGARSAADAAGEAPEPADDLAEILDAAVGMLQDLDQNRKDALRHRVQFSGAPERPRGREAEGNPWSEGHANDSSTAREGLPPAARARPPPAMRRLTRAQFSRTLEEGDRDGAGLTVFAIPGIAKLKDTFAYIDQSVGREATGNLLALPTVRDACSRGEWLSAKLTDL
jgi:hypothetical protein